MRPAELPHPGRRDQENIHRKKLVKTRQPTTAELLIISESIAQCLAFHTITKILASLYRITHISLTHRARLGAVLSAEYNARQEGNLSMTTFNHLIKKYS
jgi:hypothetical protein